MMIDFTIDELCCGCSICSLACPVKAIEMVPDEEGFDIPQVNKNVCIECGKCEKVCPVLNQHTETEPIGTYIVALKEEELLRNSASGGFFQGLTMKFLENGGYVAGVIFDKNMQSVYSVSNDYNDVKLMFGSKYVQAKLDNATGLKINELLEKGNKVLFSGTPCQIRGLFNLVGDNNNLFTVALICEGVASPSIWNIYIKYLQRKNGAALNNAQMRSKKHGWMGGCSIYSFDNGKEVVYKKCFSLDPYISAFIEGFFNRKSCRNCKFKKCIEGIDMLCGDAWGISVEEKNINNNNGMSTVIICSDKGKKFFDLNSSKFFILEKPYEWAVLNNNIVHSGHWSSKRNLFFDLMYKNGEKQFENIVWKLENKTIKRTIMKIMALLGYWE